MKLKNSNLQYQENKLSFTSTLNDLVKYSMDMDNQNLFEEEYTHNMMLRPIYLNTGERTPCGLGCFIDIRDDRKMIWSAGEEAEYATLFLKSPQDSLSFILVANKPSLYSAFELNEGQLTNTPFYHSFLHMLSGADSSHIAIDFYAKQEELLKSLQAMKDAGKQDAAYQELTSYLRMYKAMNKQDRYTSLKKLHSELFPNDIPLEKLFQKPITRIDEVIDYMQLNRSFRLSEATEIDIFATAEFTKELVLNAWEMDHVEFFLDLNHDKSGEFDPNGSERQYRLNYDYPIISGNAPTFAGISMVQHDPSPTRYNLELALPWKVIFNNDTVKIAKDQALGFDITMGDNDGSGRKGSLSWYAPTGTQPWNNTSNYGSLILADKKGRAHDSLCYSIITPSPIPLDGKNTGEWNGIPRYQTKNDFQAGISGPKDGTCWIRTRWDEENLYLFIEVEDNVKLLLGKTKDYGWITSAAGDTLWVLNESETQHAGGHQGNRMINTSLLLEAGEYTLNYQTNQNHSMGRWTNERPDLSFYGIILYQ